MAERMSDDEICDWVGWLRRRETWNKGYKAAADAIEQLMRERDELIAERRMVVDARRLLEVPEPAPRITLVRCEESAKEGD